MKIIDISNAILGRAGTRIAKLLLSGETVLVVNAEKAVVRGTKGGIMQKFARRYGWRAKGNPISHGPNLSRRPDRLVFFTIKHMLPHRKGRGLLALKRLKVLTGLPSRFEKNPLEKWPEIQNTEKQKFLTVQQISQELGFK